MSTIIKAKVIADTQILSKPARAGDVVDLTEHQAQVYVRRGKVEIVDDPGAPIDDALVTDSVEDMKRKLDEAGIKYRSNATQATLARLCTENGIK